MFASLGKAFGILFDGTSFGVVVWSLLLTIAIYIVLFVAAIYGVHHLPTLGAPWVNTFLELAVPVFLVFLPFFLGAPVAAFFASMFLEEVAKKVEARYYPTDPVAVGAPFGTLLFTGLRLTLLVVLADVVMLPADIAVPGVAEFATVLINGLLLGREYFELAALRHLKRSAADALRKRHSGSIFWAGVVISVLTVVPIVNLITPLFAAAFMVHLYKRYSHEDRPA